MLRYVDIPDGRYSGLWFDSDPWRLTAEDQCWDAETLRQLKEEYNVVFCTDGDGVTPIMVSKEWGIVLGCEDDGTIYFNQKYGQPDMCFSLVWVKHFMADLKEAYKMGVKELWEEFGDVPMDPETECIESDWRSFPKGTHREDIWHWFEEEFGIEVHTLMYGE